MAITDEQVSSDI